MKKGLLAVTVCGIAAGLLFNSSVFAQKKGGADAKSKEEAARIEAQKQEAARQEELAQKRKAAEQSARLALSLKEWTVYVRPESGKGRTETDVLTFTAEGQVSAKNISAKGYNASNFRLTIQDDGLAIWETMQVDKDKNVVFLRGNLKGDELTGSFFFKPVKGDPSTYLYTTVVPAAPAPEETPKKKGKK